MILYIFISYLVVLGMIFGTYDSKYKTPTEAYFMFAFSPFVLPIIIGMMLTEKSKKDNE